MADQELWFCRYCKREIDRQQVRSMCCKSTRCRERHAKKKKAAYAFTKYLLARGLVRGPQNGCDTCHDTEFAVQCHHLDYDYPEKIQWLCPTHHSEAHKAKNV